MSGLGIGIRILAAVVLVVVLPIAALGFVSTDARWRMEVVRLKIAGKLDQLPWADLLPMLKPGSEISLQSLPQTPNPYAVINNPYNSPHDIKTGRALFRSQCQTCHGPGARGALAPALVGRELTHGWSDWALFETIKYGVDGTPMAAHNLSPQDLWKLVAYVKDLNTGQVEDRSQEKKSGLPAVAVTFDRLRDARAGNDAWATYYGSYNGYRYSTLEQINRRTVQQLQARWIYQLPIKGERIQSTPLAVNGRLFITDPFGGVISLDAATGKLQWRFTRPPPRNVPLCCVTANRGVAILGEKIFVATLDAHLIALDAATGKKIWERPIADYQDGYSSTGAPLVVKNMVVTGVAGSEFGAPGFIGAYSAEDGKPLWRVSTIPQRGEKGNDTWAGDSWRTGGAATWMAGTYDPDLDLIFWGTGNPAPDYDATVRAGDNLYSNSMLALRADTGELAWYFQFSPGDDHDWDSVQVPVLADVKDGSQIRKVLLQANRNGFFYVLDRATGKFINGLPYVQQTWADHLDATGRPIRRPEAAPSPRGTLLYPGTTGATNWWPPTYNPVAQLFVAPALERAGIFFRTAENERRRGEKQLGGNSSGTASTHYTAVRALDPLTGKLRWERRSEDRHDSAYICGLLSTAGGLVFASDRSTLIALNIDDGSQLWSFEAGGEIFSPPSTYSVGGEQIIAFAAGDIVVGLALPPVAQRKDIH